MIEGEWKTHYFNETEMANDREVILAADKLIDGIDALKDENMWKIKQDGVPYTPDFSEEYRIGNLQEDIEFIYTLWLKGILQYVGVTHILEKRIWEHASGNPPKIFDVIRYTKCPVPKTIPLREGKGKRNGLVFIIEKEISERFGLNLNEDGNRGKKPYEQQWISKDRESMYIRTKNDYRR